MGLVFVAVYQRALSLTYVEDLLQSIKDEFTPLYTPGMYEYASFTPTFQQALKEAEARAEAARHPLQQKTAAVVNGAAKGAAGKSTQQQKGGGGKQGQRTGDADEDEDADGDAAAGASGSSPDGSGDEGGAANGEVKGA